jgi:hypothetical protein
LLEEDVPQAPAQESLMAIAERFAKLKLINKFIYLYIPRLKSTNNNRSITEYLPTAADKR